MKVKSFTAVDWRTGPDRIYFFFKDTDTYSRFNLGDNKVGSDYPASVAGNWGSFDESAKTLRFGFTTTNPSWNGGIDTLWLFYHQGNVPSVCEYSQQTDEVISRLPLSQSKWAALLPYFERIVGVMWSDDTASSKKIGLLMNDGNYLVYEEYSKTLQVRSLADSPWSKLASYKDRLMTAVMDEYPTFDSYSYIFLNDNQYFKFVKSTETLSGPHETNDNAWPGLFRD
ncbi:hypothetical protein GIW70_01190 [Pseudomonas syringae]|nr:hypothetical protein [Pseudomonas syringae]MCF5066812.1 hypothetical protein [Pseudomonas syringae]